MSSMQSAYVKHSTMGSYQLQIDHPCHSPVSKQNFLWNVYAVVEVFRLYLGRWTMRWIDLEFNQIKFLTKGISVEKFSELCRQDGLERLDLRYASSVCYDACITPCSLILALVYLERLRCNNPEYLATASPSQIFLVAVVSNFGTQEKPWYSLLLLPFIFPHSSFFFTCKRCYLLFLDVLRWRFGQFVFHRMRRKSNICRICRFHIYSSFFVNFC